MRRRQRVPDPQRRCRQAGAARQRRRARRCGELILKAGVVCARRKRPMAYACVLWRFRFVFSDILFLPACLLHNPRMMSFFSIDDRRGARVRRAAPGVVAAPNGAEEDEYAAGAYVRMRAHRPAGKAAPVSASSVRMQNVRTLFCRL